jgi:hypothetical protein
MSSIKILICIKIFVNPLFQSKEDKELSTIKHVPPWHNFYFDDSSYCRGIPMFLNPCYESSLHHADHVLDIKVYTSDIKFFDKFMDLPSNVETLNPKSNSVNTFINSGNAFVGLHVWEVGGHFFWILIDQLCTQYTSVGWHFGNPSIHKFVKLIRPTHKANDTFLYAKFHPT